MPYTTNYHACKRREQIFKSIYLAANKMLARLGADGQVNTETPEVCDLMNALYDIDNGVFSPEAVFFEE